MDSPATSLTPTKVPTAQGPQPGRRGPVSHLLWGEGRLLHFDPLALALLRALGTQRPEQAQPSLQQKQLHGPGPAALGSPPPCLPFILFAQPSPYTDPTICKEGGEDIICLEPVHSWHGLCVRSQHCQDALSGGRPGGDSQRQWGPCAAPAHPACTCQVPALCLELRHHIHPKAWTAAARPLGVHLPCVTGAHVVCRECACCADVCAL